MHPQFDERRMRARISISIRDLVREESGEARAVTLGIIKAGFGLARYERRN